ncbi:uncharacterized protein DFL_002559 [Arthrobotrys flagrans]|uniref:PB1 domain-containing protein n=1 Tax=Arthrobotrys flagrans TaxID=97331 RepID=A0A437AB50_ARTFL|nr:hypothetical protein DFL_002559 [Arthrobotrys flagrans]
MAPVAKKQDIEAWVQALERYDQGDFKASIETFAHAGETAKASFNIGIIHATLGEHDEAVFAYKASITQDPYFAIAHFQRGVSNFLLGNFAEALKDFTNALRFLRENLYINYGQLGLKFCLYRCEVLFNRGLCYKYLDRKDKASRNFEYSAREKMVTERHAVCDEAVGNCGDGYTVFSVPVGVVFRLTEGKTQAAFVPPPVDAKKSSSSSANAAHAKAKSVDETKTPQRGLTTLSKARLLPKRSISALNKARTTDEAPSSGNSKPVQRAATTAGGRPRPPPLTELSKPSQRSLSTKKSGLELRKPEEQHSSTKKSPLRSVTAKKSIADVMNSGSSYLHNNSSSDEGSPNNKPQKSATVRRPGDAVKPLNVKKSIAELKPQGQKQKVLPPTPQQLKEKQLPTLPPSLPKSPEYSHKYKTEEMLPNIQLQRDGRDSGVGTEEEDGDSSDDDIPDYYGSEWSGRSRSSWATSVEECPEEEEEAERKDRMRLRRKTVAVEVVKRIKLKIHFEDDLIAMMITPDIKYKDFASRVMDKLRIDWEGKIRFKDEDGHRVLLGDQEDLDGAIDICERAARETKNPVGKIEVWVS